MGVLIFYKIVVRNASHLKRIQQSTDEANSRLSQLLRSLLELKDYQTATF